MKPVRRKAHSMPLDALQGGFLSANGTPGASLPSAVGTARTSSSFECYLGRLSTMLPRINALAMPMATVNGSSSNSHAQPTPNSGTR